MKTLKVGGLLEASEISLGCWRIAKLEGSAATRLVAAALEEGVDFFDNADIYGGGACEEIFGRAVKALGARDRIKIQTKCGIRSGFYDFSKEHILSAAEGSLKRLGVECIDVLLLHQPDTLIEPEEVAEAFDRLAGAGKVRYFGVSNQNPGQMQLLQKYLKPKLIANQLQLSLTNATMIDAGLNVNMLHDPALVRDGGILEYCRLNDITVQAWSPLQYGVFEGTFMDNDEKFGPLNEKLRQYADAKGVSSGAVAFAWLLRHPAKIQVIAGTTDPGRLKSLCAAADVTLSRQEWYDLYLSAGKKLP